MIFEIIRGGGGGGGGKLTHWVEKEWAGLLFPPEEKTDWGEIPACYTGELNYLANAYSHACN